MRITLHTVTVGELVDGYSRTEEQGVRGYGGRLNIRPPYQREFVYNEKQRQEVVNSIFNGFPLNVMYWVRNAQGTYELLDGQQRTLSICQYRAGEFPVRLGGAEKFFDNLDPRQLAAFQGYGLQVYICEDGTDQEQLDWFRIINIAGERLTPQELRNAVYAGPWVTSAKLRFSKSECVAYRLGSKYMSGTPIRQDYLETVLRWISKGDIERYMAAHQRDGNSDAEWQYYQRVMAWVQTLFPPGNYRKEMKGLPWGELYDAHRDKPLSATKLEEEVARLMMDDDVTNKKGVYEYVLSGDESRLSIRAFTPQMKREAYERQEGVCPACGRRCRPEEMEGDHITPWSKGGRTVAQNCQMLCRGCNRRKGGR